MTEETLTSSTRTSEAEVGRIAHKVLADQLKAGLRSPTTREVMLAVGDHPAVRELRVRSGGTARQKIVSAVCLYYRLFHPAPGWTFEGSEVSAPGCRFDLVWKRPDGKVVVDEIKTGRLQHRPERRRCEEQVERLHASGLEVFGDRFAELRLLVIGAPARSFTVDKSGVATPMTWSDR